VVLLLALVGVVAYQMSNKSDPVTVDHASGFQGLAPVATLHQQPASRWEATMAADWAGVKNESLAKEHCQKLLLSVAPMSSGFTTVALSDASGAPITTCTYGDLMVEVNAAADRRAKAAAAAARDEERERELRKRKEKREKEGKK